MGAKILVDYRERKVAHLIMREFENVDILTLPVGDFLIVQEDQGMLIERKEANDFIASMKNNRLWEQMRRMLTDEVNEVKIIRRALVIHGLLGDALENSGMGWNHVMGAFMEIQYKYGIPIFHAEDDAALLHFLRIAIKRENEGKNEGEIKELWSRAIPKKDMSEEDWKLYVLSSIPFVGEKMAKNLLEHFGSIEKIARANILELKKVEGIGDKKAKKIYAIFH